MDIQEEEIIYKLFKFGIFGAPINKLSNHELQTVILKPYIELITTEKRVSLQNKFENAMYSQERSDILTKHNINIDTKDSLDLLSVLDGYYIRLNLYTFKSRIVGDVFNFQRALYFVLFDLMVRNDAYIEIELLRKISRSTQEIIDGFIKRMVELSIFEEKEEGGTKFYRLRRRNGIIEKFSCDKNRPFQARPNWRLNVTDDQKQSKRKELEIYHKVPFYEQVKNMILTSSNGVTSADICKQFNLKKRFGLSVLKKVQQCEDIIGSHDVAEGKITKIIFFNKNNIVKRDDLNDEDLNKIIVRKEKIDLIRDMINESGPVFVTRKLCVEFAERLKSKFIPDTKNLSKLAIESGLNVYRVDVGKKNTLLKKVLCPSNVNYTDIVQLGFTKQERDNTHDLFITSIHKNIVRYKKFIERDNGYLHDKKDRISLFHKLIIDKMDDKDIFIFDESFIDSLTLEIFFKLVPYHCYLLELEEHSSNKPVFRLVETTSYPSVVDELVDLKLTIREIKNRNYDKFNETALLSFCRTQMFSSYIYTLKKYGIFHIEKTSEAYEFTKMRPIDDIIKKIGKKQKFVPYIPIKERTDFFQKIKGFERKTFFDKAKELLDKEYTGENNIALSGRLKEIMNSLNETYKDSQLTDCLKTETKLNEGLIPIYKLIKRQIFIGKITNLKELRDINIFDIRNVIGILQREGLIRYKLGKEEIELKSNIKNVLDIASIKIIIPDLYFYGNRQDLINDEDEYISLFLKIIFYILVENGTLTYNQLMNKIKILQDFELDECLYKLRDAIDTNVMNDITYISLKEPNII